jgi:hypothetical protein
MFVFMFEAPLKLKVLDQRAADDKRRTAASAARCARANASSGASGAPL